MASSEATHDSVVLPAIVFLVCGVHRYATGAVWDLAAVITPAVIPLALALTGDPILAGTAVFTGATLGIVDLYGDGMILASKPIGAKPIEVIPTILPQAVLLNRSRSLVTCLPRTWLTSKL